MTTCPSLLVERIGRPWSSPRGAPSGIVPADEWTGRDGRYPLTVGYAKSERKPRADDVRKLWKARHGNVPNPLLLVVAYREEDEWKAAICGPAGDDPPVESGLDLGQVERLADAALNEPSRHAAIRFLAAMWAELETELPGLRNAGMLASHELRDGVPLRPDWDELCERGRPLLDHHGRDLVQQLGFTIETGPTSASVLEIAGTKRAVAVFLDEGEEFEQAGERFGATSPVSYALALADRESLPWVVATRGRQIRVYSARPDVGVGRKGRAETYIEANLALLPDDRAGYVPLLFSAHALGEHGTFEQVLEGSRDYAADLGARLRDRVYEDAVPTLAMALANRQTGALDEEALGHVYEQALTVLFRLLFVAYAEDKDLLPYRSNGAYREHALKTRARDLADRAAEGTLAFDEHATDLWDEVATLWLAVDKGNTERGVPAYNGGLFSSDPTVSAAGAALASVRLTNAEFGPALAAMLVDEADGTPGAVDFRSLSVREFGTIYEGLLESSLSVAPSDLTLDARKSYVPAGAGDEVVVHGGEVYFHNRSGTRKSTGSYFTKPFAVEHLLDHALEPALDDHLARITALLDEGEEARAAEAFFDFRCVDIAMGSGHFLVAAVDRIEARLSGFLALRPIPQVVAELERLRAAALDALGPLGEGTEIEHASLLRRQVARRCVYGVDLNPIAVELARLAIWIHTFVPGLPLSFLDHTLVRGNSLAGIGTIDEAVEALDPGHGATGTTSYFTAQIEEVLGRASAALRRMARATDASAAEIADARAAMADARDAVMPARQLFDLIVAARQGAAALPTAFDEADIAANPDLTAAVRLGEQLDTLHFPIAFPEVFLRDRGGFDCILGNPPWEEATVEELGFWAARYPGLKSLPQAQQQDEIHRLRTARTDLVREYEREVEAMEALRALLLAGPYPGMGTGDPDLYKAFCWRFWHLTRDGGRFGVVLPRSALSAKGSAPWRERVLAAGEFTDVTMLLNTGGWVFDDAEHRYTIGLVAVLKTRPSDAFVTMRGPYASLARYAAAVDHAPARLDAAAFSTWSEGASFPLLPTEESVRVFLRLRTHPRLDVDDGWRARPYTELHATNDRRHFDTAPPSADGMWPVYKGASFDLWNPDTGTYYGWADPARIQEVLQEKRRRARSAFDGFPRSWIDDPTTLPCRFPRIAFRDVTNRTNTRTVIATLVPPDVVITNKGPYLLWPKGDERDQAYLLGVLCSIPLDWYARRFVEISLNYHIFNAFPVPRPDRGNPLRRRVVEIAGRLAAVDDRYAGWADAVGVPIGGVAEAEKDEWVAELDAAVALLYGLDEDDVRVIFETFHEGWDHRPRLDAVLAHFRRLGAA